MTHQMGRILSQWQEHQVELHLGLATPYNAQSTRSRRPPLRMTIAVALITKNPHRLSSGRQDDKLLKPLSKLPYKVTEVVRLVELLKQAIQPFQGRLTFGDCTDTCSRQYSICGHQWRQSFSHSLITRNPIYCNWV